MSAKQKEERGERPANANRWMSDIFSSLRWLRREYEKLRRSLGGLTFDSITGWLNSHIGLVGEKTTIGNLISRHETYRRSNEITYEIFKTTYHYFVDARQEVNPYRHDRLHLFDTHLDDDQLDYV